MAQKQTYYAVMVDETGCEFPAQVEATGYSDAREQLWDDYPESRVDQLETALDRAEREARTYRQACRDNGDDDFDDEDDDAWEGDCDCGAPLHNQMCPDCDVDHCGAEQV